MPSLPLILVPILATWLTALRFDDSTPKVQVLLAEAQPVQKNRAFFYLLGISAPADQDLIHVGHKQTEYYRDQVPARTSLRPHTNEVPNTRLDYEPLTEAEGNLCLLEKIEESWVRNYAGTVFNQTDVTDYASWTEKAQFPRAKIALIKISYR